MAASGLGVRRAFGAPPERVATPDRRVGRVRALEDLPPSSSLSVSSSPFASSCAMQAASRVPGQHSTVKIYNAVYSSVQVYECMVRGIAVMRRRADSFVNATQILKVAGVDKGRRTKILEKEILPGIHEIVQGGYGKYQGTWIPLERGRDIALQFGVAPLLAPLFDFVPNANPLGGLPAGLPNMTGAASPRPLSAASSFSSLGTPANAGAPSLAPPPILPGSALRLLNQGRAQGLFTPSTSMLHSARQSGYASPGPYNAYNQSPFHSQPGISPTPPLPGQPSLKRTRSEADVDSIAAAAGPPVLPLAPMLAASPDIQMADVSQSPSRPSTPQVEDVEHPSPTKRARTEPSHIPTPPPPPSPAASRAAAQVPPASQPSSPPTLNGVSRPPSTQSILPNGKITPSGSDHTPHNARFATKPSLPRGMDPSSPARDARRVAVVNAICKQDDPASVLDILREIPPDNPGVPYDLDLILDDQGHTALHLAASMARHQTVNALISSGADIQRGNYNGETPLIRACLATHNAEAQTFHALVAMLHPSIRTIDTSRKSVVHHIVASAGVKGRALVARYYLDQIFIWVAQNQAGDFRSIVDLQDEHGDTALNIAARVGNRGLVRTLLDVNANRILPNKLGLRPGDFGVETEELGGPMRADDIISSLRSGPSEPQRKSQDVVTDIQTMLTKLHEEFTQEIKGKQDNLDVTQAHLRAATRELSEQRKQIQTWQSRCSELDIVMQRTRNIQKALVEEDSFDWTGRTDIHPSGPGRPPAGPAFQRRGENSTMSGPVDIQFNMDPDPAIPMTDTPASLIRLRRMKMWYERMERLMDERIRALKGSSAEKEFQCKKILSLCTGIPIENIEDMLDDLVLAVESEASVIDLGRVSTFMTRVGPSSQPSNPKLGF
ncbi:transcriptional regulator swi6 [Steccherinum ochraceum]|uniref:Transcriptional regulator swi6 n=1 Tax=Steccherinum ochraceum TaxID=92696 RepID=A0A4V2MXY0_9APHY|nr:transcriptional regulator swi6 [Steccherinum ochraceum]